MKHKSLIAALLMLAGWYTLTSAMRDPNNPPTGRTGAPNETTCQTTGCHSGGTFTGTVDISGIPDTVIPNQSYTITLTQTSNATRAGFEMTCLDGSNLKCGTFTVGTGCSVATASNRQYIRQSSAKTLNNGSVSWTYSWKAPAAANGNLATFYFASLAANGNGKESGDNALKNTKTVVVYNPSVATNEAPVSSWLQMFPTVAPDVLQVRLLQNSNGQMRIFDRQGALLREVTLTAANTVPVNDLPKGLYLAQIQAGNKQTTQKFIVP